MKVRDLNPRLIARQDLQPGDVIAYPFLFPWQRDQGLVDAEKMRPCLVMLRFGSEDEPYVAILPITTRPIENWDRRLLIPMAARGLAGLNAARCQSVVIDNCNVEPLIHENDMSTASFLPARIRAGRLPDDLMTEVKTRFRNLQGRNLISIVKRQALEPAVQPEPEGFTPIPGY